MNERMNKDKQTKNKTNSKDESMKKTGDKSDMVMNTHTATALISLCFSFTRSVKTAVKKKKRKKERKRKRRKKSRQKEKKKERKKERKEEDNRSIFVIPTGLLYSHLPYIINYYEYLSCFMQLHNIMAAQVLAFFSVFSDVE